jgi:hypothetical protein
VKQAVLVSIAPLDHDVGQVRRAVEVDRCPQFATEEIDNGAQPGPAFTAGASPSL